MENYYNIQRLSNGQLIAQDIPHSQLKRQCAFVGAEWKKVEKLLKFERIEIITNGFRIYLSHRIENIYAEYFDKLYFEYNLGKNSSFKSFLAEKYLNYFETKNYDILLLYWKSREIKITRKELNKWKSLN